MVHRLTGTDEPAVTPSKVTKSEVSRVMAAMGRRGGRIGGKRICLSAGVSNPEVLVVMVEGANGILTMMMKIAKTL